MTPETSFPAGDHVIAARLASMAGELLIELRERLQRQGVSGKDMGREGDAAAHELLTKQLAELRPEDAVVSEEGRDQPDPPRLAASRVWIIDPLDGTREFSEPPRTDWAVHVALTVDGEATVGAVALPAQGPEPGGHGLTLTSEPAPSLRASRIDRPPRILVSRSRPPEQADHVARALGGELVPMGSAGAKAMAVVQGEAEVYVHAGGQYEWDSAAPVAVARAAGLHVSRLDGSPLVYNQPNLYLPDLLICRRELAEAVLAAAGSMSQTGGHRPDS